MMYRLFIVLFISLATQSAGQESNSFNTEEWWNRLTYEERSSIKDGAVADTSIIVVTNRYKTNDTLRFMSEDTGNGELIYFYIYAYEGKWHALKTANLKEAISYLPDINNDFVVYTEGMGKIFTTELYRGMMMASQYNVNVIMLDYPSITTTLKFFDNYKFSIHNAKAAYKYHLQVLEQIKEYKQSGIMGRGRMSLFFHSMGNYLIREIYTNNKADNINNTKWADNIILNSACVPAKDHADWLRNVHFSKRIYLQYNPDDRVLKLASLPSFTTQLGSKPEYPLVKAVQYVNFNKVIDDDHSYFLSLNDRPPVKPVVWEYYNTILHGKKVQLKSPRYETSDFGKVGVDVIPD